MSHLPSIANDPFWGRDSFEFSGHSANHGHAYTLLPPGESFTHGSASYHFPVDAIYNRHSEHLSHPHHFSGMGALPATAKILLKESDLASHPAIKAAGMAAVVGDAYLTGRNLARDIKRAEKEGRPQVDAAVCETVGTVASKYSGKVMKGMIIGGIPPYLAAAAGSPLLAATIPVVAPLIPQAYAGAEKAAHKVGALSREACYDGFEAARAIRKRHK